MKKVFIKGLETGKSIKGQFIVIEKTKEKAKTGRIYATVKLADKTGRISGKIWEDADKKYALFDKGDVVLLSGTTSTYKGILEIHINNIRKCKEDEFDAEDFLPITKKDRKAMFDEIINVINSFKNSHLKALLKNIFSDEYVKHGMMNAPASVNIHHAYIGGLLEHTLNVARICDKISDLYPEVDRELVVSGALLHDIGKIEEYSFSGIIQRTNRGKLIGHIALGTAFIWERIEKIPDFPEELAVELTHLIISHHGEYEFGSPKLPQTVEAAVLAYADLLDSRVESFLEIKNSVANEWSKYISFLGRSVYTGKKE